MKWCGCHTYEWKFKKSITIMRDGRIAQTRENSQILE